MSQLLFDLPDFTGWTLEEARSILTDPALSQDWRVEIQLVETAPPMRPIRESNARAGKKTKPNEQRAPRPAPNWGQWRVLRSSRIEAAPVPTIELLIAREELAPTPEHVLEA